MRYYEDERVMEIRGVRGVGAVDIWRNSIRSWQPPHDGDPVDDAKRDAIISNIARAYQSEGEKVYVVDVAGHPLNFK